MPKQVRRVVTGHDQNGKAIVISDGPAPFVHVNAVNPEWYSTDIWRTHECPAKVVSKADESTLGPRRQMPTRRGTVLRINNFPPETDEVRQMDPEASRKAFAALGNEQAATYGKGGRHPLMHRTETIDYAIILSGEITMVLDDVDVAQGSRSLRRTGTARSVVQHQRAGAGSGDRRPRRDAGLQHHR